MNPLLLSYGSSILKLMRFAIFTVSFSRTGDLVFKIFNDSFFHFIYFIKYCGFAAFRTLNDYTAVDYPEKSNRFEVILQLSSMAFNSRLRIKTYVNELSSVQTISSLFKSSNWLEREIFDLYGISFYKHKDLRRILTDYGFIGYPFRKDFPLSGFLSARYSDDQKRVCFEESIFMQQRQLC